MPCSFFLSHAKLSQAQTAEPGSAFSFRELRVGRLARAQESVHDMQVLQELPKKIQDAEKLRTVMRRQFCLQLVQCPALQDVGRCERGHPTVPWQSYL